MSRVVLAMSGGVDSSVAAHLLLEQGHDVIGVFMRHGEQSPVACEREGVAVVPAAGEAGAGAGASGPPVDAARRPGTADGAVGLQLPVVSRLDHKQGCCTAADAEDARRVADRLDIPFYALDLQREFGRIIDYFVAEYSAGRTPNPCVQCNNWIKFGKLFDYADSVGAEFVATGHYARLERQDGGGTALLRGVDDSKDQSYVLFGIRRRYLSRMMLPVGGYRKPAIRRIAAGLGLRVAEKRDSQEICFVTRGRYDEFVKRRRQPGGEALGGNGKEMRTDSSAGELVLTDGTVVGQHEGIEGFTVGQRKGLGVALGERRFVVRIEADTRRVVLGGREETGRRELTARNTNWLVESAASRMDEPRRCFAQIRYNAPAQPARMTVLTGGRLHVVFDEPQFAVAPGQAVVCYDVRRADRVLGGGWIE